MSILITGGTGFVGVNLVRHYAEQGTPVVSLDLDAPDDVTRAFVANLAAPVHFAQGDVRDAARLRELVERHEVEYVIHAAAITPDIERERQHAYEIMDVNLMATVRVLDLACAYPQIKRTLVISSAAVYGVKPEDKPLQEEDTVAPGNLYAISKHGSELLVDRYRALHNLDAATARLGWIFGPMERGTSSSRGLSTLGTLLGMAQSAQRALIAGPEAVRDWTYTADVARATDALLHAPTLAHSLYNISGGAGYTNAALARTLQECLPAFEYEFVAPDAVNVQDNLKNRRSYLDISRLRQDTGFVPQYDLRSGLAAIISNPL